MNVVGHYRAEDTIRQSLESEGPLACCLLSWQTDHWWIPRPPAIISPKVGTYSCRNAGRSIQDSLSRVANGFGDVLTKPVQAGFMWTNPESNPKGTPSEGYCWGFINRWWSVLLQICGLRMEKSARVSHTGANLPLHLTPCWVSGVQVFAGSLWENQW